MQIDMYKMLDWKQGSFSHVTFPCIVSYIQLLPWLLRLFTCMLSFLWEEIMFLWR